MTLHALSVFPELLRLDDDMSTSIGMLGYGGDDSGETGNDVLRKIAHHPKGSLKRRVPHEYTPSVPGDFYATNSGDILTYFYENVNI